MSDQMQITVLWVVAILAYATYKIVELRSRR